MADELPELPSGLEPPSQAGRRRHRVLGIAGAILLIVFVASGVAVQHTAELGLDIRYVNAPWLLRWYGIEAPRDHRAYRAGDTAWVQLGDRLFADAHPLALRLGTLRGAVELDALTLLADETSVWMLDARQQLVDQLRAPAPIEALGLSRNGVVIDTLGGTFGSDRSLLDWEPADDAVDVAWAESATLDAPTLHSLEQAYVAEILTWERLLLDIHSGRALGAAGPYLVDLAALLLLALAVTGLWLLRR